MGITTFTYSKFIAWTGAAFFSGVIIFCLYLGLSTPPGHNKWLYLIGLILVVCILLGYFCKKYFFTMLQGKIALELDDEKLQFYITNRIIYWKDVEEITKQYGKNSLYFI